MRRSLTFACAGETLFGTIDDAQGRTGLLIVSGGNEPRFGAVRGQAMLAASVAKAGYPVLRFDRRGVGDSTGENLGFLRSGDDIAAATATFRAQTGVTRIVGFGNCDAATALALWHRQAGIDALLLANPWVVEPDGDLPPTAAIRARYAARLVSPQHWWRALRGGVDPRKAARGIAAALRGSTRPGTLALRFAEALKQAVPTTILLANGDNTAIAFSEAWRHRSLAPLRRSTLLLRLDSDGHGFTAPADALWLRQRVLEALALAG